MPAIGAVPPAPLIYHAAPPEVHSTLLNTGMTAAGVVAAGTSWSQLAAQYVAGIAELESILGQVQATYQGPSAEAFVAAHQPLLMWMTDVVVKATLAAVAHGEIAASYETAVITMPTMPELITNHLVHGTLVGTNFFGVNTIPIGLNEADYVRMWNQAADVQSGWDTASAMAVDSIPDTPPSPVTLIPGVGEAGNMTATSAGFLTMGMAQASGAALNAGDLMGSKLLVGKAASSPLSVANRVPEAPANQAENAGQQLKPDDMSGNVVQQFTSIASSAPQAASSALQGPTNALMQAPQQLASAPQQLSSLLGQFSSSSSGFGSSGFGSNLAQTGVPVGFAGTGAIAGFNPAGMTNLAGGALGTGPSRPLMPSTWGSAPTSAAEPMTNAARGISPVGAGLPGAGAGGSGAGGGGGGMMGHGANNRRGSGSQQVNTYSDDAVDDDADADSDGGTFAMTR